MTDGCAQQCRLCQSLDYLICETKKRGRNRETECFSGLEVDDKVEFGRLLDWNVGGLGALQNLVHMGGGAPVQIRTPRTIGHQAARLRELGCAVDCRQTALQCKLGNAG